jgi:hypothetical protein
MVKDLRALVLFFTSSLDTTGASAKGIRADVIASSSKEAGRQTGMFAFDPLQRYTRDEFQEKEIPLAVTLQGKFASLYAGKSAPMDTSAGAIMPTAAPVSSSPDTRIVVVGDGDFARDQFMGGSKDNVAFLANMVDYLVDDAGLITIRSKDASFAPLDVVSDGTKKTVKYANLVVPPLLVLLYGVVRWRMRKARKKALEMQ